MPRPDQGRSWDCTDAPALDVRALVANDGGVSRDDEQGEGDPRRVGAVLLTSFFPGADYLHPTELEQRVGHVAVGWQQLSAYATLIEVAGANTDQAPGRMAEIFARIASSGEQLMLVGTCLRDARRWDTPSFTDLAGSVASRGLAEMANYFALSAAHGLANTTLRLLLLAPTSRAAITAAYPRARGFQPFTGNAHAWVAMSSRTAATLAGAADSLPPVVTEMAALLVQLADDARWGVLMDRRATDFHQLRPQSVHGGAAVRNPWQTGTDGKPHLHVEEFNGHQPPDARQLLDESSQAIDALCTVMAEWLNHFADALRTLLVTPDNPPLNPA